MPEETCAQKVVSASVKIEQLNCPKVPTHEQRVTIRLQFHESEKQ